jgi:Helix-turn-helix domain
VIAKRNGSWSGEAVSIAQACHMLGDISRQHFHRIRKKAGIQKKNLGRRVLIRKSSVQAYLRDLK